MQQKEHDEQIEFNENVNFKMVKHQFLQQKVNLINLNGHMFSIILLIRLVTTDFLSYQIFDIITGKMIARLDVQKFIYKMVLNKFGDHFALQCGSYARIIHIPTRKSQALIDDSTMIFQISFVPHSQILATCSDDSTVKFLDIETGKQIKIFQGQEGIMDLDFNSNGDKLIICSQDNTAGIWDVQSGHCIHILEHNDCVVCSKFDFSGDYCATGTEAGYILQFTSTCKIWDVKTGKCIQTLIGHKECIFNISFNINGARIVTYSGENISRVFNVKTGDCITQVLNFEFKGLHQKSKNFFLVGGDYSIPRIYSESGKFLQSLQMCDGYRPCYFPNFGGVIVAPLGSQLIIWKVVQK